MTSNKSPAELMSEDLAKSGLESSDMMTRLIDEATKTAIGAHANRSLDGYVIPYFNIYGKITQYYRVKILNNDKIKYLQVKNSPNHVYFPKDWVNVFKSVEGKFCLLVEGEKKAALLCKNGIPAVAFGGVDSWRNKTLILPRNSETFTRGSTLGVKLPQAELDDGFYSVLALGMDELIDIGLKSKTTFIIAYDSDTTRGVSTGPQRAAATLGYELRFKGFLIGQIRQLVVPFEYSMDGEKATVEDVILHKNGGKDTLLQLIAQNFEKRTTFPRHPNVREYIAKQLQKPKLDRKQSQNISLALLTDLDARGTRMYSPDDLQLFYFNGDDKHLMKVNINRANLAGVAETEFGMLLYRDYSVSVNADKRLMEWLGTQFAGEDPVEHVKPYRIIAKPKPNEDIVRFQINSGQYIKVTGDTKQPYVIMSNGADNILFESLDDSQEVNSHELIEELKKCHQKPLFSYWKEVIKEARLKNPGKQGDLVALLYYMSPYLYKWRGMQLPVEIVVGEAGSGKSTLYEIRLNILTGNALLRNSPDDKKDWNAILANSGGLTVIDNVQMTDKNLRQNISDELCRLVTEPDPRVQIRKYFTEADERSIRVNSIFGFTAIQMPFQNNDLLQRAICLELTKATNDSSDGTIFDGSWKEKQIQRFGGRTAWVAHQMHVLHLFFKLVKERWDPNYRARHRLVNLEQALILMAQVFGDDGKWIPDYLMNTTDRIITSSDWAMEGLLEFANLQRVRYAKRVEERKTRNEVQLEEFTSSDISSWAEGHEDYCDCFTLTNSRSLGRYLQTNKYNVNHITGISEFGKKNNRVTYVAKSQSAKILDGGQKENC